MYSFIRGLICERYDGEVEVKFVEKMPFSDKYRKIKKILYQRGKNELMSFQVIVNDY